MRFPARLKTFLPAPFQRSRPHVYHAPVCLYELLGEGIRQQLQEVRAHATACSTRNGVTQVEAFEAITVLCLTFCRASDKQDAERIVLACTTWH